MSVEDEKATSDGADSDSAPPTDALADDADEQPDAGDETDRSEGEGAESLGSSPATEDEGPQQRKKKKKKKKKRRQGQDDTEKQSSAKDDDPPGWGVHPIVSPGAAWGLATLSGLLCPIGFAGIDVWPLAFVAWVPLIIALRGQTAKRALALGWYSGFIMTAIGFYWLVEMLEVFSGFPLALSILFAGLLCVQKGGRMALMAWLYARATGRGWHHGLCFIGAFAVSELVYPLLFPWYYGASVHNVPLLMQTADLGGPIMVTIVIIAFNVGLAELLERPMFRQAADKRTQIGGVGLLVFAVIYGAVRISSVDAVRDQSEKIKVGLVQGNMELHKRGRARQVHIKRTRELRKEGVDLVVWSEAAIPSSFNVTNYQARMKRTVTRFLRVPTVVGGILREKIEPPPETGRKWRSFNAAFMADEKGNIVGRYDKQYLLMFGEYLPLGDTFPVLYKWSPNSGRFAHGTSFEPLHFGEHKLATMICYEDIIPTFVNKLVAVGDPDLLVNMTNDTWFGDTTEPWIHLALAKFRSVEHRRYLVRVTNSGVSAIVDPVGRVVVHSDTFKEQVLVGDVHFMRQRTVFATLGQAPWWIVTALMALG
ncbi:MAG: apolipoprotein N-acyltransferase, partial [Deltaproteobacteria bacterium]